MESNACTKKLRLRLYLHPSPNVEDAWFIAYSRTPIFNFFYDTYSKVVDKDYLLSLYEDRYNHTPIESVCDRWGEEWGYIAAIGNTDIVSILAKMFMLGNFDQRFLPTYIDEQYQQFFKVKLIDYYLPNQQVILPTHQIPGNMQVLLNDLLCLEYHRIHLYRKVLYEYIDNMPPGVKIKILRGPLQKSYLLYMKGCNVKRISPFNYEVLGGKKYTNMAIIK